MKIKPKLLDQVRYRLRLGNLAYNTEKTYVHWIKSFILFHGKRHPLEMGPDEITEYLTYLAVKRNVSASTQNQALNALVFLYKRVLNKDPGVFKNIVRAKDKERVPVCNSSFRKWL